MECVRITIQDSIKQRNVNNGMRSRYNPGFDKTEKCK